MYTFHATIHALAPDAMPREPVQLAGTTYAALTVPTEKLAATTFSCTFEEASERLAGLDRIYCEPDGSFVWVSSQDAPRWQVDGNLYDRTERLLFIDIKGSCPEEEFDRFLACFGWPEQPIMFQLVREAVLLNEAEFRRWAKRACPGAQD